MARSQNGYPANQPELTAVYVVPGTQVKLRIRRGCVASVLLYLAAQINSSVEPLDGKPADDWGYAERRVRGGVSLSNHSSGTAFDANATQHPLGKVGTFTNAQEARIHALLKHLGGVVRWGGDYSGRKDEMHFEIVQPVKRVQSVVARLGLDGKGIRHRPVLTRTLRLGMRGADVKRVQLMLLAEPDGIYGKDTRAAVTRWQRVRKLQVDGKFGEECAGAVGWVYTSK